MTAANAYLEHYRQQRAKLPGAGQTWLAARRDAAIGLVEREGLPGKKTEAWRWAAANLNWPGPVASLGSQTAAAADAGPFAALDPIILTLADGKLAALPGGLPEGLVIQPLADALADPHEGLQALYGAIMGLAKRPLAALNLAVAQDGVVIRVQQNAVINRPVLVRVTGSGAAAGPAFPRIFVSLGRGAGLTLIDQAGEAPGQMINSVLEADLADGANLDHIRLETGAAGAVLIGGMAVRIAAGARYHGFALQAGEGYARSDYHVALSGPGAVAHVSGAQLRQSAAQADFVSLIEHAAPGCESRQIVHGVAGGTGRVVFQGKIHVHPGAQQTDGHQLTRALLLSADAEADHKPELEIYADDVKCSHGATTGDLDEAQLFYLRARGIPLAEARHLLVEAYLAAALDEIRAEGVRAALAQAVQPALGQLLGDAP